MHVGQARARIDLSIVVDGHSTAEACDGSETFRALQECLVDVSTETCTDTRTYSEYGCRVIEGRMGCVPWRIYLKGPSCARGKHNSHKKWYQVLDDRIRKGLAAYPTGMLHMDADVYLARSWAKCVNQGSDPTSSDDLSGFRILGGLCRAFTVHEGLQR